MDLLFLGEDPQSEASRLRDARENDSGSGRTHQQSISIRQC
jgi:hypothetical protein